MFRALRQFSTSPASLGPKMQVYESLPKLRNGQSLMEYVKQAQYEKFDKTGAKRKALSLANKERIRADDIEVSPSGYTSTSAVARMSGMQ